MKKNLILAGALGGSVLMTAAAGQAGNGNPFNPRSGNVLTVAVYGDAPYGLTPTDDSQTLATPAFIDVDQRRPGGRPGAARRRHPFGQAVLHRGLRPDGLRSLDGVQGSARLHARRQRVDRLPQGGARAAARTTRPPGRSTTCSTPTATRSTTRTATRSRTSTSSARSSSRAPGARAGRTQEAGALAGAGLRPGPPDRRASTSRT